MPQDGMLVHRKVTHQRLIHWYLLIYTPGCCIFAQEHNTMSPTRTRARTTRSGDERTSHETAAPHTSRKIVLVEFISQLTLHIFPVYSVEVK